MNKKITSTVCAGLIVLGMGSASADTVNVLFSNGSGDSISYSFTLVSGGIGGGFSNPLGLNIFDSAVFNIGGTTTTYDSSNYTLDIGVFGIELNSFEISDANGLVSQMAFDGIASFNNSNVFAMSYFGDGTNYSAANYAFNSVTDTFTNSLVPMLYDSGAGVGFGSGADMTRVTVSTAVSAVPVPAAVWLFGSGLIGLAGFARRKA